MRTTGITPALEQAEISSAAAYEANAQQVLEEALAAIAGPSDSGLPAPADSQPIAPRAETPDRRQQSPTPSVTGRFTFAKAQQMNEEDFFRSVRAHMEESAQGVVDTMHAKKGLAYTKERITTLVGKYGWRRVRKIYFKGTELMVPPN